VLTHFVTDADEAREAARQLLGLLAGVHPPSVKQYMESSAACLAIRFPELLEVRGGGVRGSRQALATNHARHPGRGGGGLGVCGCRRMEGAGTATVDHAALSSWVAPLRGSCPAASHDRMLHPRCCPQTTMLPLLQDASGSKSGARTSAVLISAQVLLHSSPATRRRLLQPLVVALTPWTMHPSHSLRTLSAVVLHVLLSTFPLDDATAWGDGASDSGSGSSGGGGGGGDDDDGSSSTAIDGRSVDGGGGSSAGGAGGASGRGTAGQQVVATGPGVADRQLLRALRTFLESNPELARLRSALGTALLAWSPEGAASPRLLFAQPASSGSGSDSSGWGVQLAGWLDAAAAQEGAPCGLVERVGVFLAQERQGLRAAAAERHAGWQGPATAAAGGGGGKGSANVQRKGAGGPGAGAAAAGEQLGLGSEVLDAAFDEGEWRCWRPCSQAAPGARPCMQPTHAHSQRHWPPATPHTQ